MPQRDHDRVPFRRAQGHGELPDAMDIDLAVDQLVGPVYYQVLITGQPVPPEFTDALVDEYLAVEGITWRPHSIQEEQRLSAAPILNWEITRWSYLNAGAVHL
jgi:hypothetical protein